MTMFANQRVVRIVVTVAVITLLSYLSGYLASATSDAFAEAGKFIEYSPIVRTELGNKLDLKLMPFGYELEFAGNSGSARFDCNVKGSTSSGTISITLKKSADAWRVTEGMLQTSGRLVRLM